MTDLGKVSGAEIPVRPEIDGFEYDICGGWFCVAIPGEACRGFLISRVDAKNLRDALTIFIDDVEDLEPSRARAWHEYAASMNGVAPV